VRGTRGLGLAAVIVGAWSVAACSAAQPPAPPAADDVCASDRTLTCAFFDGSTGSWSTAPPQRVSLADACGPQGSHGEVDALVDTRGQYWLDRVGFAATGTAVRVAEIHASDDAGGATYGCGEGGGAVLTKLLCGKDVGAGRLALAFTFAGRWADGTTWSKECDAEVDVTP
jgi:hypothetical protein